MNDTNLGIISHKGTKTLRHKEGIMISSEPFFCLTIEHNRGYEAALSKLNFVPPCLCASV